MGNNVPMSTWTRVYYNNALAFCLSPPFLILGHEYSKGAQVIEVLSQQTPAFAVFVSCLLGVGISFTGFGLRELVTATTFTVMGVMNKMLTVLIGSMAGGTLYQQAPPRAVIMSDEETRLVKEETREEEEGETREEEEGETREEEEGEEESKATRSR